MLLILSLLLAGFPVSAFGMAEAAAADSHFTDIGGHWAEQAILAYADWDLFSGQDGKFMPDQAITRSEFIQMLHRTLGIHMQYFRATDITDYFQDVRNEEAYAGMLYDLATMGIIDGRGTFKPTEPLHRDEMVHYIINALKNQLGGSPLNGMVVPASFADEALIAEAYRGDVLLAKQLSMVHGRGGNLFEPEKACTRAEAAVMMERLMNTIKRYTNHVLITVSAQPETDRIRMELTIKNYTDEPVTLNYTSGQRYDFALLDASRESLYTWSADKLFIQQLSSETIASGESVGYSEILEGEQYVAIKDRIAFMRASITGQSPDFIIDPEGYVIPVNVFPME
jgi:hypothetical protein